jgi:hypothetical protein
VGAVLTPAPIAAIALIQKCPANTAFRRDSGHDAQFCGNCANADGPLNDIAGGGLSRLSPSERQENQDNGGRLIRRFKGLAARCAT